MVTVEYNQLGVDGTISDDIAKLPGYTGSQAYAIGPKAAITIGEPPKWLRVHEFGDAAKELQSDVVAQLVNICKVYSVDNGAGHGTLLSINLWEMLHSEGFCLPRTSKCGGNRA